MNIKKFYYLVLITFLVMMAITGCGGQTETEPNAADVSHSEGKTAFTGKVKLLVTKDFGNETLFEKKVEIKEDRTVIDLLKANLEITTKWDGDFVNGINGLESENGGVSGNRFDWFYYINGICADVGAAGYELNPGDIVWWDYHAWKSMGSANSAVIGCFPEPFIHGYRGNVGTTTIITSEENNSLANDVQKALEKNGVTSIESKTLNEDFLQNRQGPTIVMGEWSELKELTYLEKLNKAYKKTGTNVHFTDKGLELLDYSGKAARTVTESAGVIVSTGAGLGDESPLWLIVGNNREGLEQAVEVLVENPDKISKAYGVAVVSGEIVRLPI